MIKVLRLIFIGIIGYCFGLVLGNLSQLKATKPTGGIVYKPKIKAPVELIPVAVIDSGFDVQMLKANNVTLCPKGHYDATNEVNDIGYDWSSVKHGTKMAMLISKYSKGKACLVLIKALTDDPNIEDIIYIKRAFRHLTKLKPYVKIVSMSYAGYKPDFSERDEMVNFNKDGQVPMFVAAGNNSQSLDLKCDIFPACYKDVPGLIVVSTKDSALANYGSVVDIFELGYDLGIGGSSAATAIAAGKFAVNAK